MSVRRPPTGSPLTVIVPVGGRRHPGERLHQRRLARAALADDRHELARLEPSVVWLQDLLVLDRDRDALGVEAQRAPLVAGDERRAVEDRAGTARRRSRSRARAPRARRAAPLTRVPLREPGRAARRGRSRARTSAWKRETLGSSSTTSLDGVAADASGARRRSGPPACPGLGACAAAKRVSCAGEEAQRLAADHDRVPVREPARLAAEALAVELGAVARAEVDDPVAALHRPDPAWCRETRRSRS